MIDDAEQMVQAVRENLRIAQSRQKSYADGKRRDLTFCNTLIQILAFNNKFNWFI
jgi:hypothetical protein